MQSRFTGLRFRIAVCIFSLWLLWDSLLEVTAASREESTISKRPAAGLLYYGKADYASNTEAIRNPYVMGAFFQIIWSEVEKKPGECDWSEVDKWIRPWIEADKAVALRILWSTSGYWPKDYYKHPTPQWVWKAGARSAFHEPSGTEIPLIWDPVYQRHAFNFLRHVQEKYGDNPHILFLDVTPGAETNPYRFGTIDRRNPEFRETFLQVVASDGKPYSDKLWINTLQDWITEMPKVVTSIPLLVTLNVAGLGTNASDRLTEVGAFCVEHGYLVGQNGLGKHSYLTESKRKQAFLSWSEKTPLFFEMVARSGRRTGTLMEVMQAAERIHCSLLNVYPEDVLKGTPGNKDYDPAFEAALRYGANALSR